MTEIEKGLCEDCIFWQAEKPEVQARRTRIDSGFAALLRKKELQATDPQRKERYARLASYFSQPRAHGLRACTNKIINVSGDQPCITGLYTPRLVRSGN